MPESCLEIIAHGLIDLDSHQELTMAILKNILASHLSTAFIRILVDYLYKDVIEEAKVQKVIGLLSLWKWKEKLETVNLSDYLLLSLLPKFLQSENYLHLILECVAIFLNSKSPSIVEWILVVKIVCNAIPRVSGGEIVYSFSNSSTLIQNYSIRNIIEFIVCQLMFNFANLCTCNNILTIISTSG